MFIILDKISSWFLAENIGISVKNWLTVKLD